MTEPENETGVGFFLKNERIKKGLTLEQMAKITRLRIQYVEALENEDWARLPAPVFVKGFIKSYTKALGLDYREVTGQFQESIPVHDDLPRPLVPPKKKGSSKSSFLIGVGVIIALLLVIFIATNPKFYPNKTGIGQKNATRDMPVQDRVSTKDNGQGQPLSQDSAVDVLSSGTVADSTKETGAEPAVEDIRTPVTETAPMATTAAEQVLPSSGETSGEETASVVRRNYTLTAYVTERTYIKIYVDNDPPKEFIFSPGSYPQWTGDEGFFLLIGNAGGVEFDFNGKRITGLGKAGDVVRLRLPEEFNLNINE